MAKKFSKINFRENIEFNFYRHDEFLELCYSAKDILSLSGITFYLECLYLNINAKYLIPSNFSQYILNKKYKENNYGNVILLEDINKNYSIDENIDEQNGVKLIEKYVTDIINNRKDLLKIEINNLINSTSNKGNKSYKELGQIKIIKAIKSLK